jgi:hypothetical protein
MGEVTPAISWAENVAVDPAVPAHGEGCWPIEGGVHTVSNAGFDVVVPQALVTLQWKRALLSPEATVRL